MMQQAPSVHTWRKTRLSDRDLERVARNVARNAYMVERLMPIIYDGKIIGWCGWSRKENTAIVLHHKPWMRTWIDRNGLLLGYTSVDDIINQVTNNQSLRQVFWFKSNTGASATADTWSHFYNVGGWPTAGVFNGTTFTARRHDDTELGAMIHGGNVSPKSKHLLSAGFRCDSSAQNDNPVVVLYDMVISYDACVVTSTPTSFTNTNTALRYISAGDPGLQIMNCANSILTGSINFTTFNYTSIGGTAGQTIPVTLIENTDSTAPTNGVPAVSAMTLLNGNQRSLLSAPLVNGDSGVKQLDSLTMGSTVADTINHILGFQLAWFHATGGTEARHNFDFATGAAALPVIKDGACLTFAMMIQDSSHQWEANLNVGWSS
jgi:hypothetical protein